MMSTMTKNSVCELKSASERLWLFFFLILICLQCEISQYKRIVPFDSWVGFHVHSFSR